MGSHPKAVQTRLSLCYGVISHETSFLLTQFLLCRDGRACAWRAEGIDATQTCHELLVVRIDSEERDQRHPIENLYSPPLPQQHLPRFRRPNSHSLVEAVRRVTLLGNLVGTTLTLTLSSQCFVDVTTYWPGNLQELGLSCQSCYRFPSESLLLSWRRPEHLTETHASGLYPKSRPPKILQPSPHPGHVWRGQ